MNGLLVTGIGVWIFFIANALYVRFRETRRPKENTSLT